MGSSVAEASSRLQHLRLSRIVYKFCFFFTESYGNFTFPLYVNDYKTVRKFVHDLYDI